MFIFVEPSTINVVAFVPTFSVYCPAVNYAAKKKSIHRNDVHVKVKSELLVNILSKVPAGDGEGKGVTAYREVTLPQDIARELTAAGLLRTSTAAQDLQGLGRAALDEGVLEEAGFEAFGCFRTNRVKYRCVRASCLFRVVVKIRPRRFIVSSRYHDPTNRASHTSDAQTFCILCLKKHNRSKTAMSRRTK